jgi:hypothetical protein
MGSNVPLHRYGWLEQDAGMWHFLTDLFADPGESSRQWSDSQRALEELRKEGWMVISPYPDSKGCGYGLIWNNQQIDRFRLTGKMLSCQLSIINRQS